MESDVASFTDVGKSLKKKPRLKIYMCFSLALN